MSEMIFIKYLSIVKSKVVSKLKVPKIEIWHIWYFKYDNLDFHVENYFCEMFTTWPVMLKLVPKLKVIKIYLNLACMIFQISRFWCQKSMNVKNFSQISRLENRNTWNIKHEFLNNFNIGVIFILVRKLINISQKSFLTSKSKSVNLKHQMYQISINSEHF